MDLTNAYFKRLVKMAPSAKTEGFDLTLKSVNRDNPNVKQTKEIKAEEMGERGGIRVVSGVWYG